MNNDLIRYDILVKDALRDVIRKVLIEVSKAGLPGQHHFFVTFLTNASGVKISPQLKKLYPEQMTIVIQHQFWDLIVNDTYFEISLSFNNVAENLVVPFAAVQCFYDPYASFEAAFNLPEEPIETESKKEDSTHYAEVTKLIDLSDKETDKKIENDSKTAKIVSLSDFRRKKD